MSSIEERVQKIIVEQLGVKPEDVKSEASFVEDLGADSLDTVELVMEFKDEFDLNGSTPATLDDWSRTQTQPYDMRYGAGELNIDNSHLILSAGEQTPGVFGDVATTGWDFGMTGLVSKYYYFEVPETDALHAREAEAAMGSMPGMDMPGMSMPGMSTSEPPEHGAGGGDASTRRARVWPVRGAPVARVIRRAARVR